MLKEGGIQTKESKRLGLTGRDSFASGRGGRKQPNKGVKERASEG